MPRSTPWSDCVPEVVHGSPHELADVCLRLRERRLKLSSPLLVVAAGEPLHADVRALVEERLGVAPRQVYGSTEVGFVAWECERGALHVNSDLVWCENRRRRRTGLFESGADHAHTPGDAIGSLRQRRRGGCRQ